MANIKAQAQNLTRGAKAAATRAANEAAKKAEQLKAARAEHRELKRKQKEAAAAHAASVQPQTEHVNVEDLFAGVALPSWKRVVVGLVLGLAASCTVGYGIGMLMAYALAGIATLTASAGMAFVLSVLVWALGLYAGWKLSGYIGGKVFASVVLPDGLASKSYDSVANAANEVKAKVGDWFKSKPIVQQAQAFTGAHAAA